MYQSGMIRGLGETYTSGEEVPIEQKASVDAIMEQRAASGGVVSDVAFRMPTGQIVNVQYSKALKPAITIAGFPLKTVAIVAGIGLLAFFALRK